MNRLNLLLLPALIFVSAAGLCIRQQLPLERNQACVCLSEKASANLSFTTPRPEESSSPAPSPGFAPAEAPAFSNSSSGNACKIRPLSSNHTSWCLCEKSPKAASSPKVSVEIPSGLHRDQIAGLFPLRSLGKLDSSCSKCVCPVLNSSAAAAPDSNFAPEILPPPWIQSKLSVCLCTNCSRLNIPPAESPAPESDGHDWETPEPPPVSSSNPLNNGGAVIFKRQPPPRVTITNVHKAKQKVLAYVLPVTGFVACIVVFLGVLLGRSLLFWRSSSSSSQFSHLENEI